MQQHTAQYEIRCVVGSGDVSVTGNATATGPDNVVALLRQWKQQMRRDFPDLRIGYIEITSVQDGRSTVYGYGT